MCVLTWWRLWWIVFVFFFQAEDGIRDLVRSRGLGDVYKRQVGASRRGVSGGRFRPYRFHRGFGVAGSGVGYLCGCLLYTSDAADERSSVDLGGRRIIKKKKNYVGAGGPMDHTYNGREE